MGKNGKKMGGKSATVFHYSYLLHIVVYIGVEITSFPEEKAGELWPQYQKNTEPGGVALSHKELQLSNKNQWERRVQLYKKCMRKLAQSEGISPYEMNGDNRDTSQVMIIGGCPLSE